MEEKGEGEMGPVRFGRLRAKRGHYGFCAKVTLAVVLGLCFIVIWSVFSSPSSSLTSRRSSFSDIPVPSSSHYNQIPTPIPKPSGAGVGAGDENKRGDAYAGKRVKDKEIGGGSEKDHDKANEEHAADVEKKKESNHQPQQQQQPQEGEDGEAPDSKDDGEVQSEGDNKDEDVPDEDVEIDGDVFRGDDDIKSAEKMEDENGMSKKRTGKKKKNVGPLFDPRAHYSWKLCSVRSKHNYIPCIDIEGTTGKLRSYRHQERSCPAAPPMCLVSLPEGYGFPVHWPESKSKVLYANVAHPKLSTFIKTQDWLSLSGDHLIFQQNISIFKGGALHYIDSIEEMVPDIEWGKNIRLVLDIRCTDSSFSATLLDKEVMTLSWGLKDDQADLAQVALERGFPAVIGSLATRRLPFPGGVFDAIHCGDCKIHWYSNGGKLLLEMNRILRPGGYFVMSTEHENIETEEALSKLTASICWNILAHRTDEISELGVKIYQKPSSNAIYELRRKKNPPLCKEDENPDAAWYTPMKACLHKIPAAIEERGTEWPEEWPQRLDTFPDWLSNRANLVADTEHWKAIVSKSYLIGMGIDWSNIRNVMDMKAIHGGFAAALASLKVWVMNVVPVHAPDTLPIIYERGLLGIYHDWCESFSSYPRSYDLLHADHLFSRLKNRCKTPAAIVVEMDRILRPGGWVIIRDKVEILNPLEMILRSLHWDIQMTFAKDREEEEEEKEESDRFLPFCFRKNRCREFPIVFRRPPDWLLSTCSSEESRKLGRSSSTDFARPAKEVVDCDQRAGSSELSLRYKNQGRLHTDTSSNPGGILNRLNSFKESLEERNFPCLLRALVTFTVTLLTVLRFLHCGSKAAGEQPPLRSFRA